MIFVANLENFKKKVKFPDSSKLKTWIGEFSGMMVFLCNFTKKLLHACACQNGNEFGVSLELTPNSKKYACTRFFWEKICVHKGCLNWKKHSAHIFFEFGECSKLEVEFGVRSKVGVWVWSTLQTQGLSLECAPNSGFSLECPPNAGNDGLGARNKIQHACNHNRCFSFSGQQVQVNILAFWRFETGNCGCRFHKSPMIQFFLAVPTMVSTDTQHG